MIIKPANRLQQVEEYYFSKKLKQIALMREQGKPVINLGIGSPDLAPSEPTIQALHQTALNPHAHGYQSYIGTPQLRSAIAQFYERTYQVTLNPATQILPLMGSKEGIMHCTMAFTNPFISNVLVPNLGYPSYSAVANLLQANIQYYPLNPHHHWQPDWDYLENIDTTNTQIMWVCYPNMPTGAPATPQLFERLIDFAQRRKLLIINDNPYSLVLNPKPTSIFQHPQAFEVALELNSLSKSHNMAGWRVGMLCGNESYINTVLKVKSNFDSGMFLGIQNAAAQALTQNTPQWHSQQNELYAQRKKIALEIIQALNCHAEPNQVGMFVWAKTPTEVPDTEQFVENLLQNKNIFITPGFIFGEQAGKNYIRISLCSTPQTLTEALQRITAA